jgi:hypothetical protein
MKKKELIEKIIQSQKLSSSLSKTPNNFTFYKNNLFFLVNY